MRLDEPVRICCTLCGSKKNQLLWKKDISPNLTSKVYLAICRDCGFVFQNPRFSLETAKYYYFQEFDQQKRDDVFSNQISDNGMRKLRRMFSRIEPFVGYYPELNCLDIGAGAGHFLNIFKEHLEGAAKLNLFAIEPSHHCKSLLSRSRVNLLSDDVDSNWDESGTKFDVVIMRHVLEHFYNPLTSLKKVSACLKEKGFIYLAVPNLLKLKPHFYKHVSLAHLSYFSASTLKHLIDECNLAAISWNSDGKEIWCILKASSQKEAFPDLHKNNSFVENKQYIKSRLRKEILLRTKERLTSHLKHTLSCAKKTRQEIAVNKMTPPGNHGKT